MPEVRLITIRIAVMAIICLAMASCSTSSVTVENGSNTTTTGKFQVPSIADLPRDTTALSGYIRTGSQFSVDMPVNLVVADEDAAIFSPTGGSAFSEMACAGYFFSNAEGTGSKFLQMAWNQAPPTDNSNPTLYIGLANWDELTWDWYAQTDMEILFLDAIDPYIETDTGRLFVIVIVRGTDQASLAEIGFPGLEAPDLGPRVEYLNRIAGLPGEEIHYSPTVFSVNAFDSSWDFGGGAEPNTSTERWPDVTLGAEGIYDCNLTVSNDDGTDSYDFQLHVTDDLYLVGGYTGHDYMMGEDGGIEMLLSNGNGEVMVQSNGDGMFAFTNVPNGNYTLTPIEYEYWNPVFTEVVVNDCYVTNLRFFRGESTSTRVIQGSIFTTGGGSVSCEVNLTGDIVRTSPNGILFTVLPDGDYVVTPVSPAAPAYSFYPPYREITVFRENAKEKNFLAYTGTIEKYTISGTVTVDGNPAAGITIKLDHVWNEYATTDASGYYEFLDVPECPGYAELNPYIKESVVSYVPALGHKVVMDSDKPGLNFAITIEEEY